jgi:hypothetical protein
MHLSFLGYGCEEMAEERASIVLRQNRSVLFDMQRGPPGVTKSSSSHAQTPKGRQKEILEPWLSNPGPVWAGRKQ